MMVALWWLDFWIELVDVALTGAMDAHYQREYERVVSQLGSAA